MAVFGILLSWSTILLGLLKMFRRLLSTMVDLPPVASTPAGHTAHDLPGLAAHSAAGGSAQFRNAAYASLNWLHREAPCFPVQATNVRILNEPAQFYETLVQRSRNARQRIVLASLYLGTGEQEHALVRHIGQNVRSNAALRVNVLLDCARGTRPTGGPTPAERSSSQQTLMPLLRDARDPANVCISLYHTPALRGLSKRLMPPRWNELIGLQHMKLYVFDDTVIVSGANLSRDYFTNRQDRYIVIEDRRLADFYAQLVNTVQRFSFRVCASGALEMDPRWAADGQGSAGDRAKAASTPFEGDREEFVQRARETVLQYFSDVCEQQRDAMERETNADTWIFPLVEMGQLGIHHDSLVTRKLLSESQPGSELKLATGYFNLTNDYMRTITDLCSARCSILMAHPNANGFQGAKGAAGGIPAAYTLIARNFHKSLVKAGQADRVKLFEYQKTGWSYHAKGLWYYLPESALPNVTLIGSSNFGERSVNRDLESQVCLVTENGQLQRSLQAECDSLYRLGSTAEQALLQRPVPKWVRAVVSLFRNYF